MNITEIKDHQVAAAADVLTRAFGHDPIFHYIFRTPEKYAKKAPWLFSTWIRWSMKYGKAFISEDAKAVMLLRGLGNAEMSLWSMIRAGMLPTPFRLGLGAFKRFYFDTVSLLDKKHAAIMGKTPHWYGWMLGVDNGQKGLGNQMLKHCFSIADTHHLPVFLETSIERNVSLYNYKEFKVIDTCSFSKAGFTLYFMVRQPKDNTYEQEKLSV